VSAEANNGADDTYPKKGSIILGTFGAYMGDTIADAVAREGDPQLDGADTTFSPGDQVNVMGPAQNWTVRQPDTGVVTDHYKYPVTRDDSDTRYWVPTRNVQLTDDGIGAGDAPAEATGNVSDLLLLMVLLAVCKVA